MSLFSSKQKLTVEECCSQFYDRSIFKAVIAGKDAWQDFLDYVANDVSKVDSNFSSVDRCKLWQEMTAIRMEIFALVWAERFKKEKYTYPQSYITWEYLSDRERINLWELMREYNKVISDSVYCNAKGEHFSGAIGRGIFTFNNSMRFELFKTWGKNNPNDEIKSMCVSRALNRFGSSVKQKDCLVVKLLGNKLIERLGKNLNLNSEAFFKLTATIFGFCKGAEDYLKDIDVQV
jgi:hypothetical protein